MFLFAFAMPLLTSMFSLARWHTIANPFHSKFKSAKFTARMFLLLWLVLCFLTAAYASTNYSSISCGVCLPFTFTTTWQTKTVTFALLSSQVLAFAFVSTSYVLTVRSLTESTKSVSIKSDSSARTKICCQLVWHSSLYMCSWILCTGVNLVSQFSPHVSREMVTNSVLLLLSADAINGPLVHVVFELKKGHLWKNKRHQSPSFKRYMLSCGN